MLAILRILIFVLVEAAKSELSSPEEGSNMVLLEWKYWHTVRCSMVDDSRSVQWSGRKAVSDSVESP